MIQDFESSGLIEMAAQKYRVIAFDRPRLGHSKRPRRTIWKADRDRARNGSRTFLGIVRCPCPLSETPRGYYQLDFGVRLLLPKRTG
jgi:hypothetical protein